MGFFGTHAVTRRRATAAETRGEDGYIAAPTYTDTTIRGNLQRLSPQAIQLLPEGERTLDQWGFATTSELRTRDELAGLLPDLVVVPAPLASPAAAVTYEVRDVSGPESPFLPHYEARIVRVAEGRTP